MPMFPVLDFMADYTAESLWPMGCLPFLMKRTVNLRVPVVPGQKTILHQMSIEILRISTFLIFCLLRNIHKWAVLWENEAPVQQLM